MADPSHSTPPLHSFTGSNVMKVPGVLAANNYTQGQQPVYADGLTNGQPALPAQSISSTGGSYGMGPMQAPPMGNLGQSVRPSRLPVAAGQPSRPNLGSVQHTASAGFAVPPFPARFPSTGSSLAALTHQSQLNGPSQGQMATTAAPPPPSRHPQANGLPPFMVGPQQQQQQHGQPFPHAVPPQGPTPSVQSPQYSINPPQPPTSNSDWMRHQAPSAMPSPQTDQQPWLQQQRQQQQQRQHPPIVNSTQSPATSGPPSAKSSRNPSPIPSQGYDAMEGQFTSAPNTNNSSNFTNLPGGGLRNGVNQRPPMTAMAQPQLQQYTSPHQASNQQPQLLTSANVGFPPVPQPPRAPPLVSTSEVPNVPTATRPGGITARRQYPQQPHLSRPSQPLEASSNQSSFQSGGGQPQWQPQLQQQQQEQQNHPLPPYAQPAPQVRSGFSGPSAAVGSGQPTSNSFSGVDQLSNRMSGLNAQWSEPIDLMQSRNILPKLPIEAPTVALPGYDSRTPNCNPDLFRCTLTKIPESQNLLQKSRLPLGVLIHPFKDLTQLAVVQCNVIVRCRTCRTYINPFVQFVDQRRWKCNLCFRVNELAEEFQYDPISKTYGDPSRRPEIRSATIEFIAPSEYMLRPPQPAVYLFALDVSYGATETGYLRSFCDTLLNELDRLPGDSRTRIGFITFDNAIHFYNLSEGLSQPQMMVVSDIEDVFIPCPDNLLVNLSENKELVKDLLQQLPVQFMDNRSPDSAFGAALQAAYKLVSPTGGRIMVMQTCLPNMGPGALKPREDPNLRAGKEVPNLSPANDFYKKLSLDCSGQQVAVDLFLLSSLYCDIATLSCISKFSGGCIHYYPGFHAQHNIEQVEKFEHDLKRYLTRKVGFEAVMRIRCTKGLSIHTFHGNFFVRSTDLLSLPNINPDAGFAMQMSIEESLIDNQTVCFQAALLYTSSKGERRIRVHTMCLPVTTNVLDVIYGADQQAIVALLTKMAVDRSLTSSLTDARDALINACIDAISAFKVTQGGNHNGLIVPLSLKLLPLYILAILKNVAFRLGTSTKLDERVFAMNQMKSLPLTYLMPYLYPNMYPVHNLEAYNCITHGDLVIPQPPLLHLSAEKFERNGMFLVDAGDRMFIYVYQGVSDQLCRSIFNVATFDSIPDKMSELSELENPESERLRNFVNHLQSQRPFHATLQVLKSTSKNKNEFLQYLIEDRTESTYSYFEFLKHLQQLMSK